MDSMIVPRKYFGAVKINKFIYVIGGQNSDQELDSIEYYN
jgi:hypothetical protein